MANADETEDWNLDELADLLPQDPSGTFARPPLGGASQAQTGRRSRMPTHTISRWRLEAAAAGAEDILAGKAQRGESDAPAFQLNRYVAGGGFGEIWEAIQASLGRIVAVKRLRPFGFDLTDADIHRIVEEFEREAIVTATLEHPNIVPVHDLGRDDMGRPLLAMKMVKGDPWDDIIARDFESMEAADYFTRHVEILIAVCQAVAFAHSRGVIHRDLKPSQVVVGEFGEVVVLDWGLAMLFDETLLPQPVRESPFASTLPTRDSATNPCGTPAFMAPEQTVKETGGLGPWTDVFLLGATLYFILTGKPPYAGPTSIAVFREATVCRPTPPRERVPGREMPEELVQLCRRAMGAKPQNRPASVRDFMADLEAWLSGSARRRESAAIAAEVEKRLAAGLTDYEELDSAGAELRRAEQLWPTNPALAPLTERVMLAFAREALAQGDLGLARWQADQIGSPGARKSIQEEVDEAGRRLRLQARQRRVALAAAGILLAALVGGGFVYSAQQRRANMMLAVQIDRADGARRDAEDTINFIVRDLRERLEPVGQLPVLEEMAEKAVSYYDNQAEDAATPDVMLRRIAALRQLGDARQRRGRLAEALVAYERGMMLVQIPGSEEAAGELWMAERGELLSAMGEVKLVQGALGEAEDLQRRALAIFAELRGAEPRNAHKVLRAVAAEQAIARVLEARGQLSEALEMHRAALAEALALSSGRPRDPMVGRAVSTAHNAVGRVLQNNGRLDEALASFRSGLEVLDAIVAEDPGNRTLRRELSQNLRTLGGALELQGKIDESAAQFERSLGIDEELSAFDPANIDLQDACSTALNSLARVRRQQGRLGETLALFQRSMEIRRRLLTLDPTNARWQRDLSVSCRAVGGTQEWLGLSERSLESYRSALAIISKVAEIDASNWRWQLDKAITHGHLGRLLRTRGDLAGSAEEFRRAMETNRAVLEQVPGNVVVLRERAWAHGELGSTLLRQGQRPQAVREFEASIEESRLLHEQAPDNPGHRRDAAVVRMHLGSLLRVDGNLEAARKELDAALADLRAVSEFEPSNALRRAEVADCLFELATAAADAGDHGRASAEAAECESIRAGLSAADGDNALLHLALARAKVLRGRLLVESGDLDGAATFLADATREADRIPAESRDDEASLETEGEKALLEAALLAARGRTDEARAAAGRALERLRSPAETRSSEPLARLVRALDSARQTEAISHNPG